MVRFHETLPRSIAKAITFRILVITLDSVVVYLLTRRVDVTVGVVAISNLASTIAYILHERA
ncbi:MAG TPA: DUF2061 domain-containing protein, partial [Candidatus Nanoarchaeia archaeon]|nr:DUF2061 domain-containing protein [Candidatus Nanoarchaeia archaeon]